MDRKGLDQDFDILLKKHLASSASSAKVSDQCPDENIVTAYLERKLPQNLKQSFERHASRCNRCQQELGFLLKEEVSSSVVSHGWEPLVPEKGPLAATKGIFRKFQVWGLKPAFALILVTIISGYIGYEVLKQRSSVSRSEADHADARLKRDLAQEQNLPAIQPKDLAQAPSAPSPAMPSPTSSSLETTRTRVPSGADRKTDRLGPSVETANAIETKQSVHSNVPAQLAKVQETGEAAPKETSSTVEEEARRDSLGATFTHDKLDQERSSETGAPPQKTAEPGARFPKRTLRDQEGIAPSLDAVRNLKPQEEAAGTLSSAVPKEAKQGALGGTLVSNEKKAKAETLSVRAEKEPLDTLKATEGTRVEVAGKLFLLRKNVWTDLSITPGEPYGRVFISRSSPDFAQQVKPFSAYQRLLSRPEDMMVLYQGKVYWISSRSHPPEEP
jgi:hypothetical protein